MADKLAGKKGSWFEWEQWQKMVNLGSRNLMAKTSIVEDADGRLSISERSVAAIEKKKKEAGGHDRRGMEHSR